MSIASAGEGVEDVGALYRALAPKLDRIVRRDVQAADGVIEEACQFAWSRLVSHADNVQREAALAWLIKTAMHEAFKLARRDRRDISLDAALEQTGERLLGGRGSAADELVERRARLEAIATLPARQRRLVWMQGLGFSYAEMALHTGCTARTVERQLLRAKRQLRRACDE
jgi:RNA polymerase sigma factor (sigma-70 family)